MQMFCCFTLFTPKRFLEYDDWKKNGFTIPRKFHSMQLNIVSTLTLKKLKKTISIDLEKTSAANQKCCRKLI